MRALLPEPRGALSPPRHRLREPHPVRGDGRDTARAAAPRGRGDARARARRAANIRSARALSNCPSAQVGGSLGQLLRGDSVPEFDAAVFDTTDSGVLPRLVNTRFGFHIVRIERRVPGDPVPFDAVAAEIAAFLAERVRHKAIQQYVTILASGARIEGVALGDANGPLVQ
ncbi:peptidylprolyl isomerase [Burkholderia pseudomallei]|uniref:peptidylprolyl isomerase n=1 Tax=Burkholderia pseudomallei TaxID=28450 RepID=UPI0021162D0E|nr:peptidylprolyl isomerase [Burkholderia pseudomallei]MDA5592055.1 peptidylprolyl isomerase [Burkholderia pseudomallei]WCK60770.1 peptidylprolyl isomerase [Burkholderia pseudomallei]